MSRGHRELSQRGHRVVLSIGFVGSSLRSSVGSRVWDGHPCPLGWWCGSFLLVSLLAVSLKCGVRKAGRITAVGLDCFERVIKGCPPHSEPTKRQPVAHLVCAAPREILCPGRFTGADNGCRLRPVRHFDPEGPDTARPSGANRVSFSISARIQPGSGAYFKREFWDKVRTRRLPSTHPRELSMRSTLRDLAVLPRFSSQPDSVTNLRKTSGDTENSCPRCFARLRMLLNAHSTGCSSAKRR